MNTETLSDKEKVETFIYILIARATGGDYNVQDYKLLRDFLINSNSYSNTLPSFVKTCRDPDQFWSFIKPRFNTYAERRDYIWNEFNPLLEHIEGRGIAAADLTITEGLQSYDEVGVNAAWAKALDRRLTDPDGAITASRTLIETVCKHILDEQKIEYNRNSDLQDLYKLVANELKISANQHDEIVYKQILKGCSSVIGGLGTLRNRLGDSHGQGKKGVKPSPRHAALAVNMAGTMSLFLIETWQQRYKLQ
ncbi:abortive infection family protein [Proteus mirabilis]|uniref:abortive infection family protein n=1 Tax=Proteus TaxID=583 RepID=UPI0021B0A8F6|nr:MULTISPECIES: abortive infection family protein [Proteus]EMC9358186.1 abortive infection family protein [Proteus mirabilis]EMD6179909.1 abortive infection family protein [Proteus mirabilis]MCT6519014.1 abortive infection family protein [Proteus vulgaris]MCX2588435.1 abortive infection family protein [Proteus penneri]